MIKNIFIFTLILILVLVLCLALIISLFYIGYWIFNPNPPVPTIKYAEFPFELEYEIDGKVITIKDTYVCQFNGIGISKGKGKYRQWKGYIKSLEETSLILVQDDELILRCYVGSPEYYMSDPEYSSTRPYTPHILREIKFANGVLTGGTTEEIDELMKKYKIKIIRWQFSNPIENMYK